MKKTFNNLSAFSGLTTEGILQFHYSLVDDKHDTITIIMVTTKMVF